MAGTGNFSVKMNFFFSFRFFVADRCHIQLNVIAIDVAETICANECSSSRWARVCSLLSTSISNRFSAAKHSIYTCLFIASEFLQRTIYSHKNEWESKMQKAENINWMCLHNAIRSHIRCMRMHDSILFSLYIYILFIYFLCLTPGSLLRCLPY